MWRRLIRAQESGLVVVIALLMAALTILGGSKPQSYSIDIPAGATVESKSDEQVLVVTSNGRTTTHESDRPWRVRRDGTDAGTALGFRTVSRFLERENLVLITTKASFYAVMAVGMTGIIVLAGIDLSIGSIYAIAAFLGAMALSRLDPDASAWATVPVALVVCCLTGAVAGAFNGGMSVGLRLHPFIITLGTMAIYRGLVFILTRGQSIGVPESMQRGFFKWEYAGTYPVLTIIMLVVALSGVFVLSRTVFGRWVYAIGGNETAAKYAGIPVGRTKTLVYAIAGALAGLSACMYIGYFGAASTDAGQGYELQVIAAAVIGGASLSGGRGSAIGAVLGAILVQLLENTMLIFGIDQSWNQIVMGTAIIVAVVIDQTKARWMK